MTRDNDVRGDGALYGPYWQVSKSLNQSALSSPNEVISFLLRMRGKFRPCMPWIAALKLPSNLWVESLPKPG
jgi:hypothetical protein